MLCFLFPGQVPDTIYAMGYTYDKEIADAALVSAKTGQVIQFKQQFGGQLL